MRNAKTLNGTLTKWVINLHQQGYTDDFLTLHGKRLQCVQNGESFSMEELSIKVIDQGFDHLTKTYKYVHAIDTQNGGKGILIADAIFCTPTQYIN